MNLNSQIFTEGLVKCVLDNNVGIIRPIIFDWDRNYGVALMNPSIYNDGGILRSCVRCVNYTLHHSEHSKYPHWAGPLQYIHPETDVRLATENFIVEFNDDLDITSAKFVDMRLNVESKWNFHGLEDGRLVRWNDKLYLTGVRRDTTDDGQGRMELSEIEILDDVVVELSRQRIPTTGDDTAYCEKNWMPVLDTPYRYVKWTNPTEIVDWDPINKQLTNNINYLSRVPNNLEVRGGSQVVKYDNYYIAFGHSVSLWKPYSGEKDSDYKAHIMIWDENFNLIKITEGFKFFNSKIEFCCGLCLDNDNQFIVSFADMDNAAYVLRFNPEWLFNELI